MDYKSLYKDKDFGIIKFDEFLKFYTNFGIGGPADVLIEPKNEDELIKLIRFNHENKIKTTIIGNGTNILVTDKGIRGCVVILSKNYDKIEIKDQRIKATSGSLLSKVAKKSFEKSLTGMEKVSGIPGTIGGAVSMNAGAYGKEMKDIIESVRLVDRKGQVFDLKNEDMVFSYRHSIVFDDDLIVSSAIFKLDNGDYDEIIKKYKDYTNRRTSKQPLDKKSAGSTFKRPEGSYASKLIDECGLRGYSRGDCQVSEKHCGFVINKDKASFEEMNDFIKEVAQIVKDNTGFVLKREVKILGER